MRAVGIFLFDDVEILDATGPYEVFSVASRVSARSNPGDDPPFKVFTIGEAKRCRSRHGLELTAQHACAEQTDIDALIVPGGVVTAECKKPHVLEWIVCTAQRCEVVASVCTGAFLLAYAGLLDGRRATTHWEDIDDLRRARASVRVVDHSRWTEDGKFWTSAGIAAGIDMSLELVARLAGLDLARRTARQMDYDWRRI
jgi:transcriptional regulator GlxA family with amidase domain